MSAATAAILADPAKMMEKKAPRVIRNDKQLKVYSEALFSLTALENPSEFQEEAIELLTMLVQQYQKARWTRKPSDPVSLVRHLIEAGNLSQHDLIPEFGSDTAVSLFLSGKRRLNMGQIQKLAARFKLDPNIFMTPEPCVTKSK
jgi:HTH-type transcriptional regulator / antitoxin HigA